LCAGNSLPYSLLENLQVNLRIEWQDAVVQFDLSLMVHFKELPCKSHLAVPRAFTQRLLPIILYVGSVRSGAGMLLDKLLDIVSRVTRR
jgi:hypothetical protein